MEKVLTAAGLVLGSLASLAMLEGCVALDKVTYPMGAAVSWRHIAICLCVAPVVAIAAALIAMRPALKVKPLEAASNRMPKKRHLGMLIAFACGFGAFVAVEVWGSSLMSAFVPSPEWPDAIVSILPGGVSAFDIEKVQSGVKGVRKIHELAPLQVIPQLQLPRPRHHRRDDAVVARANRLLRGRTLARHKPEPWQPITPQQQRIAIRHAPPLPSSLFPLPFQLLERL